MKTTKAASLVLASASSIWMAMPQNVMAKDSNTGSTPESSSIQQANRSVLKDFQRIDSLNTYTKNWNNEILTLQINSPVDDVYEKTHWARANDRGTISELKCDSMRQGSESRYLVSFGSGAYSTMRVLYYGNKTQTYIAATRTDLKDSALTRSIESWLIDLDFKKDNIQANRVTFKKVEDVVASFVFKPFMWSEKIRSEYRPRIEAAKSIEGEDFKLILDSYQIASGNKTGVGQLLAIKDYVAQGNHLTIKKWSWGKDVIITNVEQLRGFIQSSDPVIDIMDGKEFKN